MKLFLILLFAIVQLTFAQGVVGDTTLLRVEKALPEEVENLPSIRVPLYLPPISYSPIGVPNLAVGYRKQDYNAAQMIMLSLVKTLIAKNVEAYRSRWHFIANSNRYFMSGMQNGLLLDANVGPQPQFDPRIFLDPNFDQRVYNPNGIYSKGIYKGGTITAPIFKPGQNPTDKINW